jgi:hypothetical protein
MADWWRGHPDESYWCEITDRPDIGADLKCPQTNEAGAAYRSYSLINEVKPGEIVFHYSTREKALIYLRPGVPGCPSRFGLPRNAADRALTRKECYAMSTSLTVRVIAVGE